MLDHEPSSPAERTDTYEYPKTKPDPYGNVLRKGKPVLQEMTERFKYLMTQAVKRAALPMQQPHVSADNFVERVHRMTDFQFHLSGKEELEDADVIFANHQGPRVDDEPDAQLKSDATPKGFGGIEGLLGPAVAPGSRIVLKRELVLVWEPFKKMAKSLLTGEWKNVYPAFSNIVKALAFRKARPITVDRTGARDKVLRPYIRRANRHKGKKDYESVPKVIRPSAKAKEVNEEERTDWQRYAVHLREERNRVADKIDEAVIAKEKVVVYGEGTRSPDGKILGFVSEYFERLVTNYIQPRMKTGNAIRIGLLIADTLQAFPDGVGSTVPAYDKPITMKGMRYDASKIVSALQKREEETGDTPLSPEEIRYFGRMLLIDVHKQMSIALEKILTETQASALDEN